jgi:hypothetical protein
VYNISLSGGGGGDCDEPPDDGGGGQDPKDQCDPLTGAGCTPSIIIEVVDGFLEGVGGTLYALLPGSSGPESCLIVFGRETMSAFVPISPSAASVAEPLALFAGQWEVNHALKYAASRPNVTGGKGLLFPFKSAPFRELFSRGQKIASRGGLVLTEVLGMGQALYSEWEAYGAGRCQ